MPKTKPISFTLSVAQRHKLIKEVGSRLMDGEYGLGTRELPSAQSVLLDLLADELGLPDLKSNYHKLTVGSTATRFTCLLPLAIVDKLQAEPGSTKGSALVRKLIDTKLPN